MNDQPTKQELLNAGGINFKGNGNCFDFEISEKLKLSYWVVAGELAIFNEHGDEVFCFGACLSKKKLNKIYKMFKGKKL